MGIKRFFVRACGLCSLFALITLAMPTTASAHRHRGPRNRSQAAL